MNAATLSHASGRHDSGEVLWEDGERVFCRLSQKDAEGHRPVFASTLAGAEHPTFEHKSSRTRIRTQGMLRWRVGVAAGGTGVIRRANFWPLKGGIACGPPSHDGTPRRLRRARNQSADRCGSQQRHAALRFLAREPPDLAEVREALNCVISETYLAGDILGGIREQIKKASPR